ncbi:MAG: hypothetical protein ACKO3R_06160 [bacterium]
MNRSHDGERLNALFSPKKSAKTPSQCLKNYPEYKEIKIIDSENFMDYFTR